ncbi:sugar transferase [Salinibacterium sp. SWN1162]|uniref:sugar transferase n=1 Tax=Salinibacterium sp. SWN1162 TaxID=2792053 RepID=UPI0018CD9161|nr:sugar transferase [Salinibacterium sp. SWN1162]MBH0008125.1 sugar transferase [Salinibacterium sp. SWN1162]
MVARKKRSLYDPLKRAADLVCAAGALVVLSPVLLVIALLVRTQLGSPVIFTQERPGLDEKIFRLRKFRTMKNIDPSHGLVTDAERLTRFGKRLRSSSLDELPALLNVVRGEMSIVGPRPLLVRYLDRYSPEQSRRHEVRPGITGLAQVNGRNNLSWEEKFAFDLQYVDTRSAALDLEILRRTFSTVLKRGGVAADGHATTHEFLGTPSQEREEQ